MTLKRANGQAANVAQASPSVVDLFCGCGGMAWGLKKSGFRIVAGVDNNEVALETFRLNFPEAVGLAYDLGKPDKRDLLQLTGLKKGDLDVLVGGPPCQGFSKNVPRSGRFLQDPRNQLVKSYLAIVELFLPKVLLMENVAEMANAFEGAFREEIFSFLESLGYETDHEIHNAAQHGVPQRRRRVLYCASRTGIPVRFPQPTHSLDDGVPGKVHAVKVWEAIGDLAPVRKNPKQHNTYSTEPLTEYQKLMRRDCEELTDHEERILRPTQQARYDALAPGEGLKQLPAELRTKGGYSGAYGRLTKDMVAPTITRWVFHPGSGRFGHPVEHRIVTIREAARLQSFSDDFRFVGGNQDKSWQIGNAVPPLLMCALAPSLREALGLQSPGHQRVVVGIRNRNTDYKLVPSNRPSKQCKRVANA